MQIAHRGCDLVMAHYLLDGQQITAVWTIVEAHSMSSWISVAVGLSSSNIRNAKDIIIESLIGGFRMSHMANANASNSVGLH
jgi:3-keto-L-gulonate-6-phosphate decarboxylase